MQNLIIFFRNILLQDYILFFVSVFLVVVFFALGINKLYKAIFGLLIGFTVFMMLNLGFHFLNNTSNLYMLNGLREYLKSNKDFILILSFFSIPIFPLMVMFNESIDFHSKSPKYIKYIKIFIGSFFLIPLILAILNGILENKLLFGIDYHLIEKLNSYEFLKKFLDYFGSSLIYQNIDRYGYILLLVLLLYVFYEIIFSGIITFILGIIKKIFIFIAEKIKTKMKKKDSNSQEDTNEHTEHGGHHH